MERFERQIILQGFGIEKQNCLQKSKVLLIGAGGLGCPALLYLAAAGVGTLGIADGDSVCMSNLNRQVLFGTSDIGKNKAEQACNYLREKYSDVELICIPEFITNANALQIFESFDLIIDGSDNFETRYLINDACVLLGKPLITAAVYQLEGQVGVFNVQDHEGKKCTYRDAYPNPPRANEIPNCEQTGVLGIVPGIMGTLQAAEAIKLLISLGQNLFNKLLVYNFSNSSFYEIKIGENPASKNKAPLSKEAFLAYDYSLSCTVQEINWEEAISDYHASHSQSLFLDVRNPDEKLPFVDIGQHCIPLNEIESRYGELNDANTLYVFCQTGNRSKQAVIKLKNYYPDKNIYSLKGGALQIPASLNQKVHGG